MRIRTAALIAALLAGPSLVAVGAAGHSAGTGGDSAWTPFELTRQNEIVVEARLNGGVRARLIVDTGSSHSVVSEELARTLEAPAVGRASVTSSAATTTYRVVRLDRVEIGPIVAEGVLPSVAPGDAIDPTGRAQGLLGQDLLAAARYTLDYDARRILWLGDAPAPAGRAATLPLIPDHGRLLVDVPQRGSVLRLVPDSGAEALVINEGASGSLWIEKSGGAQLSTLAGSTPVKQGRVRTLQIGPVSLMDVPVAILPDRTDPGSSADGLLPLSLFKRVTFDGRAGLLTIEGR